MRYALIAAALLLFPLLFAATTPASAQRWMMNGGYGWGTYRYWGLYGRPGGYYNPGQYRWGGFQGMMYHPWVHRNYY